MKNPQVHVGILFKHQIEFNFSTPYQINGKKVTGKQTATFYENRILWKEGLHDELLFEPIDDASASFELTDVTIGINFHWERKENQYFQGALKIIMENSQLTAINIIDVEDYLISVISSEMSATASPELLKAHAVISRSWLLAQIQKNKNIAASKIKYSAFTQTYEELIRWYDREDHTHFDVCADDHCQRYQGITRASTKTVKEAVDSTCGQVLMAEQEICDTRFSKCCGGVFEEFQSCWENTPHSYLTKQRDSKSCTTIPNLKNEAEAEQWIRSMPDAFCNTKDKKILSQVLNNYDQETSDFYRWEIKYTQKELAELIKQRSGIDFGHIIDLIPIERGTSGRLIKLKIVGDKRSIIIGKELEIRRTLSTSHLYSSAFVVNKKEIKNGIPEYFILTGSGWGHGVGLCQIGAAVMGEQGYTYDAILLHYYVNATIHKLY